MPGSSETSSGACWRYYPHVSAPPLPPMPPSPFAAASPEPEAGTPELAQAMRSAASCPLSVSEMDHVAQYGILGVAAASQHQQHHQQHHQQQRQQQQQQLPRPGTAVGFCAASRRSVDMHVQELLLATCPGQQQQQQQQHGAVAGVDSEEPPWACTTCHVCTLAHRGSRGRAHSIIISSSSSGGRLGSWVPTAPGDAATRWHVVACLQMTQVLAGVLLGVLVGRQAPCPAAAVCSGPAHHSPLQLETTHVVMWAAFFTAFVSLARLCYTLAAVYHTHSTLPTSCAGSGCNSSGGGDNLCSVVLRWLLTSHVPDVVLAGVWVTLAVHCLLDMNQVTLVVWGAATLAWLLLASALLSGRGGPVSGAAIWCAVRGVEVGPGYHPIKG